MANKNFKFLSAALSLAVFGASAVKAQDFNLNSQRSAKAQLADMAEVLGVSDVAATQVAAPKATKIEAESAGKSLRAGRGPLVSPTDKKSLGIIYPGEGIGRIMIGDRMKDVLDGLGWGKPDRFGKDEAKNEFILIYEQNKGVEFIFSAQQKSLGESLLKTIVIRNPSLMVFGYGLGVGQKWDPQSGGGQCVSTENDAGRLAVACKGVSFVLDRQTGIIEAIAVFRPAF